MWKISVIGEKNELEKNESAMKFSEFKADFVNKDELETTEFSDDVALVVFPWEGYSEIFLYPKFKRFVDEHAIVVVGPTIHFFEVEDRVIDGSVSFLSYPINSMQVESVLNEIRRIHGYGTEEKDKKLEKSSA